MEASTTEKNRSKRESEALKILQKKWIVQSKKMLSIKISDTKFSGNLDTIQEDQTKE